MSRIDEMSFSVKDRRVIIRNPEIEDSKQLIKHVKKINEQTTYLLKNPDEINITLEEEQNFISQQILSEHSLFIVAEVEGNIVGTCGLVGNKMRRAKHKVDLGIAIQERYWGLGIGRELMEVAIDWAKTNGISKVTLKVDSSNIRAINLYEKLGFEVEGKLLKDKHMSDGSYRDSYLMALFI